MALFLFLRDMHSALTLAGGPTGRPRVGRINWSWVSNDIGAGRGGGRGRRSAFTSPTHTIPLVSGGDGVVGLTRGTD